MLFTITVCKVGLGQLSRAKNKQLLLNEKSLRSKGPARSAEQERDKPRLAWNNTTGVCEREDANRTRVVGHLDEIRGVVANTLRSYRNGAVGFIDWLGVLGG
jgi:hypothetical protein